MAFVADQANIKLGSLSVLSTHAKIDAMGASQAQLKALHRQCAKIFAEAPKAQAA